MNNPNFRFKRCANFRCNEAIDLDKKTHKLLMEN